MEYDTDESNHVNILYTHSKTWSRFLQGEEPNSVIAHCGSIKFVVCDFICRNSLFPRFSSVCCLSNRSGNTTSVTADNNNFVRTDNSQYISDKNVTVALSKQS